jgi:hypothetical protein
MALALALAGARTLIGEAHKRAEAGRVALAVHAFVPFGGGPGGWSGQLEIRNTGPSPVSVLDVELPRPIVLLRLYGLPQRVKVHATGRVTMRLRLNCAAQRAPGRLAVPNTVVSVRTAGGQELSQRVPSGDLDALVLQLEREQCGSPDGVAGPLALTYEGSRLRRGVIETTVLLRNDHDGTVKILNMTGASGWPANVNTEPSSLLGSVAAGHTTRLTLRWDVSACPRVEADEVISSLRVVLITPDNDLQSVSVDLGARFARDFFVHYRQACR